MNQRFDIRLIAIAVALMLLAGMGHPVSLAQAQSIPVTDQPLFTTAGVPPLMMMVMSRDEQLFNKAYPDYTDLDGDGQLDTTYQDRFDYSGYFDPALCYSYSGSMFTTAGAATGLPSNATSQKYPHKCSGNWSGNFLNWLSMSRLDMLRFVMYGGYRSTDTTTTVLERASIPNDLHAWVKVYSDSDVASFTPYAQDANTPGISFCNATFGSGSTNAPIMRAARGAYTEWAATALSQCNWREDATGGTTCTGGNNSSCDDPIKAMALGGDNGDFVVRVDVCDNADARESFCSKYTAANGTASYKPTGLLQQYGEKGKMRFGLISGSYSKPRSGGVLRRNIGLFAGNAGTQTNGCAPGDEVNTQNGRFCNQTGSFESVVRTMNAFRLTQWSGSGWNDCNTYSILNRQGFGSQNLNNPGTAANAQNCSGWGNPLSEMYAEALRYIAKGPSDVPSPAFSGGTDLTGLNTPAWIDPYGAAVNNSTGSGGGNPYCASCSILVLASGLNSFDSDEMPTVTALGASAASTTTSVGSNEQIGGNYSIGRVVANQTELAVGASVDTYADLCTSKGVADLALARGICPDIPSMEGSYLMAGLAWKAWTTDLRPNLKNARGDPKPADAWNQVQTYTVALAENLPKFQIPIGNNAINLSPLCQANNSATATASSSGWRSCFLGSVTVGAKKSIVPPYITYGRDLSASEGSFTWVWEDSLWGNDHDNDVVTMLTYCVGATCNKSTGLPTTTPQELCFYTDLSYGGTRTCPTSLTGNFANPFSRSISSLKVPSGYQVTLYANQNQNGVSATYSADTPNLLLTLPPFNDTARSYSITGGTLPPPVAAYAGYDICWRTATSGAQSSSDACGSDGKPSLAANDVFVRIENLSAYAGNAMLGGYTIAGTGSLSDGAQRLALRPGSSASCTPSSDNSILTSLAVPPSCWYPPIVKKFRYDGSSTVKQLENPLFYSAKYGGFTKPDAAHPGKRRNPLAGEFPVNGQGDWEALNADGTYSSTPSNYFLVRDPGRLKEQLQKVFDKVLANASPTGSVAANGSRYTVGQALAYQSSYDTTGWVGDLKAFDLNVDGSLGNQRWSAANLLPAGARNDIWVGVPNSAATAFTAQKFDAGILTDPMKAALTTGVGWPNTTASVANLVAYLKGDQSNEEPSGSYRKRVAAQRLGDIVNSSPQAAYKFSFGYDQLANPAGCGNDCTSSYQSFVNSKTANTVFVGANDGMLHAFDGSATGGNELFAYIPNAVVAKIGTLAKPNYAHTFSVDGTPAIGDAYLGVWKTVLVASASAGAPAVFALDVSDPAMFSTNKLLWEFNNQLDPDMGQFTGIPSPPTLTADGNWVTAFGNGYNGASNKAKLYVIKLDDGTRLPVDPITNAANATGNGLSTATIVDAQGTCPSGGAAVCSDGVGDTIYAGDYLGNVWKFVLSSGRWTLSPSTPIFKAVDSFGHKQPITSGMFAIKNPIGGVIVYFGTGKYLTTTDNDPNQLQADGKRLINSIYAVWDKGSTTAATRADLQPQTITAYVNGLFTVTQNVFGYRTADYPAGKLGWYLDLTLAGATIDPLAGERVLASPIGLLSKLFVNIFRPVGDICLPAGVNSLLELDLLNGAASFPVGGIGGGGTGTGTGTGPGGSDTGQGPPLGSPNPIVNIPGQPGIPSIGCPPDQPNCVSTPHFWCTADVPGYPNCADPAWCTATTPGYPNCTPPPDCHPAIPAANGQPAQPASPGYPYCKKTESCSLTIAGTPQGNQSFQCRASWRQLR